MVTNIYTATAWAYSASGTIAASITLAPPKGRTSLAVATLSRVAGSGHAKAFIRKRCDWTASNQLLCGIRPSADAAPSLESGNTIRSVTFEIEASRGLGHASCLLFIF